MLNVSQIIGTCDGANIEITREIGENNIFLFGNLSEDVEVSLESVCTPGSFFLELTTAAGSSSCTPVWRQRRQEVRARPSSQGGFRCKYRQATTPEPSLVIDHTVNVCTCNNSSSNRASLATPTTSRPWWTALSTTATTTSYPMTSTRTARRTT